MASIAEDADPALAEFIHTNSLPADVTSQLSGLSLRDCVSLLYDKDRSALLGALEERGLKLPVRQKFANKLGAASRSGVPGICESEDEILARSAWLDGGGEVAPSTDENEEPPWSHSERRFLVFTSAGDANAVTSWVQGWTGRGAAAARFGGGGGGPGGGRDWDLCVAYYGDDEATPSCMAVADHSVRIKGGKFPNLLACLRRQRPYFAGFESILVADDDLQGIDADGLSALFHARRHLDAWVLQPANNPMAGKADIRETQAQPGIAYRFVNFCEVTAPLFRTDKLFEFLHHYHPRRHEGAPLVGYGIDCWFCQLLLGVSADGSGACTHQDKAAVVDCVPFVNPTNEDKAHGREIDRLQSFHKRVEEWEAVAKRRGLAVWYPQATLKTVPLETAA